MACDSALVKTSLMVFCPLVSASLTSKRHRLNWLSQNPTCLSFTHTLMMVSAMTRVRTAIVSESACSGTSKVLSSTQSLRPTH
jgi:hypothetical protein